MLRARPGARRRRARRRRSAPLARSAAGAVAPGRRRRRRRARRRQPAVAHRPPPRRPGARPRRGPAGGVARGRRRARRRRPRATGCCSCPGQEFGAFRWGYTVDPPLPGLTERPLVTRDLLPLGSAAAMDLLYALDDRFQAGVVEPARDRPGRPAARRRHDLGHRRRRLRPLPHAAARARRRPVRRRRRRRSAQPVPYGEPVVNVPDIPMVDEQSVSDPRVGTAGRHRSSWCPSTTRSPSCGPRTTSCSSPAAATGSSTPPPPGCIDGHELVRYTGSLDGDALAERRRRRRPDHRHRHQPRPRPPLAQLAGRRRLHRGRRPGTPDVLRARPGRRAPAGVRRPTPPPRRRSPSRTGPVRRPGHAPTASRSPTAPRTGRRWPSTATRRRRGASPTAPTRSASSSRSTSPSRSTTSRCASRRARPPCATSARVTVAVDDRRAACTSTLDDTLARPTASASTSSRPTGRARSTITIDSRRRARPDARPGARRRRLRRGRRRARPDRRGRARRRATRRRRRRGRRHAGVVRAHPAAHPARPTAGAPTPSRRWSASSSCPADADVRRPAVTVRLDQRATDDVLAELLGIAGPLADRRLTGVAAGRRLGGGRRRPGHGVDDAVRRGRRRRRSTLTIDGADRRRSRSPSPAATTPRSPALRVTAGDVAVDVDRAAAGRRRHEHRDAARQRSPAGPVRLEITASSHASCSTAATASRSSLPAAISELSVGARDRRARRRSTPAAATTSSRSTAQPLPVRVAAPVADLLAGEPVDGRRRATGATLDAGRRHPPADDDERRRDRARRRPRRARRPATDRPGARRRRPDGRP